MGKRMKWLVMTLIGVAVLATGIGAGVAAAADPTPTPGAQTYCGLGGGFRFGGAIVDEVVTKLLGMTEEQIRALRQQGKSLIQIAATKNVTEKQLVDAIMAYKKTQVQAKVTAKTITQEQADLMLKNMEQRTIQAVNRTTVGPMGGQGAGCGQRGGAAGSGRMNRWAR
jgi:hypothetical protein